MGFDNECVVSIQSLAGEYFCPVCRLLVYPNEALQSQCTHLYCKPCLSYVVGTTQACPYDGYLVTEADSKPLVESNKSLAETIGKVMVHCLFNRSGCTWQGNLSECTAHCSGCVFGNSPVVCNRCGVQIIHRQVQEHAQNCPGVQPQAQPAEGVQDAAATGTATTTDQTQATSQAGATTFQGQTQTTAVPTPGKDPSQQAHSNPQSQITAQAAVPTAEQWYQQQQQYQQYYQQYPGYNPYQHYYPNQQQAVPQYQQQHLQAQPQGYVQPQAQPQSQVQPQPQSQPQSQPQPQLQPAHPPFQAPVAAQTQNQAQVNPQQQTHPLPHGHPIPQPQSYPQAQPLAQSKQMPQNQQPHSQVQQPQPQIQHAMPQPQPLPQNQLQTQVQHHPQPHPQLHPPQHNQTQTHHTASHAVTGHHLYPQPQAHQQIPLVSAPHHMHVHPHGGANPVMQSQFSQQTPQMRPRPTMLPSPGQVPNIPPAQQPPVHPHAHQPGVPVHQRAVMQPVQQPMSQQYVQQPQQPIGGPYQQGPFPHQQFPVQSQLCPQGPPHSFQQQSHAYAQPQQNVALLPGMQHHQPQNVVGRPMTPNHGVQSQPYTQSTTGLQVRPTQLGANQPAADQSNLLRTNNQTQLSFELQSVGTSKLAMSEKPEMTERNVDEREGDSSSHENAKKDVNNLEAMSVSQSDAVGLKIPKYESGVKTMADVIKTEVEDKTDAVDTSKKEFVTELENAETETKQIMKEEVIEKVEDLKDYSNIDGKRVEHSLIESKEIQDGPSLKTPPLQEAAQSGDKNVPQAPGASQGLGLVLPAGQVHNGGFVQSSSHQQRSAAPSYYQAYHLGPPHPMVAPGCPSSQYRSEGSGTHPPESFQPGSAASYGRRLGHHGLPPQSLELPSVAHQGSYNHGHLPPVHVATPKISQGDSVGGPLLHPLAPGAFDSHGGRMAGGPPYGPEGQMSQRHQTNPAEAETFPNQRPGYMDDRRPDSLLPGSLERGPLGQPSGIMSNMMRLNGAPGLELRNERFKPFPDERLNPFPIDPARRVIDRGEFEEDSNQFPRPSHFDMEPIPKLVNHFPSSRPLDRGPHGFGMDVGPRPFDRGLNYDSVGGSGPSRYLSSYAGDRPGSIHEDAAGRSDSAHTHPDFLGPNPGYGRRHMDGFSPRSPVRDYPGISSRGFGGLPGSLGSNHSSLNDIDRREFHRFGDPMGNSFHESRFPAYQSHLRRGEFDGPGRSDDFIGQDFLPSHFQRGEHLGPHNLRFGEMGSFGGFPGHAREGDLVGPGNFPRPRLGEPGFRSSFSHQGFPKDGGIYTGDMESFESQRKRKPPSMGWCRICKVDCETVDGLDLHSQTREHQKMSMDMVVRIKQNAKKQKLTSSDRASYDDANKLRNANFEGRGKKH
ncbi:hypothetical protein Ddye_023700 [Dipteronia dyeriana]|uniref:RING-type domain-containing protein n=1 Tax=Dipteronia dyeriana TaxID=168575 RepID=A0AAD9TTX8_9ROSI|nr:hypothetical protein Ddye_023700 [Dipteronia dyeriana]